MLRFIILHTNVVCNVVLRRTCLCQRFISVILTSLKSNSFILKLFISLNVYLESCVVLSVDKMELEKSPLSVCVVRKRSIEIPLENLLSGMIFLSGEI